MYTHKYICIIHKTKVAWLCLKMGCLSSNDSNCDYVHKQHEHPPLNFGVCYFQINPEKPKHIKGMQDAKKKMEFQQKYWGFKRHTYCNDNFQAINLVRKSLPMGHPVQVQQMLEDPTSTSHWWKPPRSPLT